jgi:hypothetical protein
VEKNQQIIAYHGTIDEFSDFRTHPRDFRGYSGIGETILGAAFSESKEIAATYPARIPSGAKRRIVSAGLTVTNPARFASLARLRRAMVDFVGGEIAAHSWANGRDNAGRFRDYLESKGHDGITYMEGPSYDIMHNQARTWIVFRPDQIQVTSNLEIGEATSI